MGSNITKRLRVRHDYSRFEKIHEVPNLIKTQCRSYQQLLQKDVAPEARENVGLQAIFKSVFPIHDYNGVASLEFVSYEIGETKYTEIECRERGMTWSSPIKVTVQLVLWDTMAEGSKQIRDIKEQEIYFGEIPLMTRFGTFIINGTERVIVSQLHRSPGVFFDHDKGKSHASGKLLFSARVIPYRGSWLDFEFDVKDILHVRIDRRRKQPATLLLRALGMSSEEILLKFYKTDNYTIDDKKIVKEFKPNQVEGQRVFTDILGRDKKVIAKTGQKFNRAVVRKLTEAGISTIEIDPKTVSNLVAAKTILVAKEDIHNPNNNRTLVKSGTILIGWDEISKVFPASFKGADELVLKELFAKFEIVLAAGEQFLEDVYDTKGRLKQTGTIARLKDLGIQNFEVLYTRDNHIGEALLKTLHSDGLEPEKDDLLSHYLNTPSNNALLEIYRRLRPGEPPRLEIATTNFNNLFFNPERYDLSAVGRLKLNYKLHNADRFSLNKKVGKKKDLVSGSEFTEGGVLTKEDIIETVRYLLELRSSSDPVKYSIDDIDHLGNRRVRSVGELVENQYRIGLVRMERAVKERMSIQDIETLMPQELINYKPVSAALKEFFGSSQLSQFMDQTNPLSEITHKRRLSALGPGGLTRERAGFEVRDVHPTHYGRVCPIETPEGPNIGLISSLATYARVNGYGFVESPYRVVVKGKVTDKIVYLTAMEESHEVIAHATAFDKDGMLQGEMIVARKNSESTFVTKDEVTMMDVSPNQLVSVAASLIPFLENDDANRALMGSNMQRQAVPLLKPAAPLVGTGIERIVAKDSGAAVVAERGGVVESVDATRIVIKADELKLNLLDTGVDIYRLAKYQRSNQNSCINQRPIVEAGDVVQAGEIIADGPSTDTGELALGQNILVAFTPWGGYNYEDSILISERLVQDDVFTSVHIEEFECVARDTKLGNEEITKDIPNVGEESLTHLDESGIIRIGAKVKEGDILVGKITPKTETQLAPEEKLLRAIFGEKASEVRDTSLRLPTGVEGTVIGAHVFSRKGTSKDERMLSIEEQEIANLEQEQRYEIRVLREAAIKQLFSLLGGKKTTAKLVDEDRKQLIAKDVAITKDLLEAIPFEYLRDIQIGNVKIEEEVNHIVVGTGQLINNKRTAISERIKRLKNGDDLPPGVIKLVKISVAVKRRLSVGDKMAGRHGNKGVLSRVLPVEDMPYLPDGTPIDMVLNPLGVPSRMNVGQILETHLGWACREIGRKLREIIESVTEDPGIKIEKTLKGKENSPEVKKAAKAAKEYLNNSLCDPKSAKQIAEMNDLEILAFTQKQMNGVLVAAPVFEGPKEEEIRRLIALAGLPLSCQTRLFDGRTGEAFAEPVTVGVMYMLKLHHLVDEKIHARSTGTYSLVTQQPLGGKAQFGGQRLGEMEVWALEAYGAAFALQEFLTVKSDDITGRNEAYKAIVSGEHILKPGLPESFNVMCKELMSLGLNVELIEKESPDGPDIVVDGSFYKRHSKLPELPILATSKMAKEAQNI
ncbi:MAG: DNA-directed RNA polymerase subunit beta [Deltaproteobacteria bacterium]|jgi:DNA-directed RNA polymerase subunit beta|nr:DNA-directed RNA polymerase subunit beta [Deltaproteobacteria bacterium]